MTEPIYTIFFSSRNKDMVKSILLHQQEIQLFTIFLNRMETKSHHMKQKMD